VPVTFPTTDLGIRLRAAFGADLTADPSTWTWTDISSDVLVNQKPAVQVKHGKSDEQSQPAWAEMTFRLKNLSNNYTPYNPTSTYYPYVRQNTPIQVQVDPGTGYVTRGLMYADSWTPSWDTSLRVRITTVAAKGLMWRIGQGKSPLDSTIKAWHLRDPKPIAYWPAEDASGSTSLASAVGGPAMTFYDTVPTLASGAPDGSSPLVSSAQSTGMIGAVPTYKKATSWTVTTIMNVASQPSQLLPVMWWRTDNTIKEWRFTIDPVPNPDQMRVEAWDVSGSQVVNATGTFAAGSTHQEPYGRWIHVVLQCQQSGSSIAYTLTVYDCVDGTSSSVSGTVSGTLGNVRTVDVPGAWDHSSWGFGHFAVYNFVITPPTDILNGLDGQAAADRLLDTCTDFDLPFTLAGTASDTQTMGPRPVDTLTNVITECVSADGGVLSDGVDGTLAYRTRYSRYNLTAAITADISQKQLNPPFEPVDDNQQRRNDWTVSRSGGSSAHDVDDDDVDAHGTLSDSVTLNVDNDDILKHQAGWRTNLGTVDELRYPTLNLNFCRAPALITNWLALDLGDRLTISNLPSGHPPGNLDVIVEGYTENIHPTLWTAELNASQYRPWDVFTVEDSRLGRLDTAGCELNANYTAGATSLNVATTTGNVKWTTAGGDVSFDVGIGGEQVTVTAVADKTSTFVAAGTGATGNNTSLTPGLPAGLQGGDLLLVFVAIRSSGTGIPNTPAGYELLVDMSNACLFGKIASGTVGSGSTEAAPSITFTGGSAGDDTLAQTAAFRNCGLTVEVSTTQLNSSAQNIAYSDLELHHDNCVILYLGWKQDDWTSVATIGGATEIGEVTSIAGNDAGLVWDYVIQTTATNITGASFTVTGGASAISRGAVAAIRSDVQTFTVTRAVNGVSKAQTAGTDVALWRPGVTAL
jgi:hypothetical protein